MRSRNQRESHHCLGAANSQLGEQKAQSCDNACLRQLAISKWTGARLDADNRLYQATTTVDLDPSQDQ